MFGLINYEPLKYHEYEYPMWVNLVGLLVAASSILCIPVTALWLIIRTPGSLKQVCLPYIVSCRLYLMGLDSQRIRTLTKPYEEERRELLMLRIANVSKSMDSFMPFSSTATPLATKV